MQKQELRNKFLAASSKGTIKVWEKSEKFSLSQKKTDPFSLAKDWLFVEIDSFSAGESGESHEQGRTQAIFSDVAANICLYCGADTKEMGIRDIEKKQV